jgi:hypothetical protein
MGTPFFYMALILLLQSIQCQDKTAINPDPKRFVNEIEAFIDYDAKNSFPKDAVLFVGSSSIRLWKTHQAFPKIPVINRGFGGAHISDVNYYYDSIVKKYQPKLVVFIPAIMILQGVKILKWFYMISGSLRINLWAITRMLI